MYKSLWVWTSEGFKGSSEVQTFCWSIYMFWDFITTSSDTQILFPASDILSTQLRRSRYSSGLRILRLYARSECKLFWQWNRNIHNTYPTRYLNYFLVELIRKIRKRISILSPNCFRHFCLQHSLSEYTPMSVLIFVFEISWENAYQIGARSVSCAGEKFLQQNSVEFGLRIRVGVNILLPCCAVQCCTWYIHT